MKDPFRLAPMEIETGAFFPVDQVRPWLRETPEDFSPVFAMCALFPWTSGSENERLFNCYVNQRKGYYHTLCPMV